jgi:hypothetical protein
MHEVQHYKVSRPFLPLINLHVLFPRRRWISERLVRVVIQRVSSRHSRSISRWVRLGECGADQGMRLSMYLGTMRSCWTCLIVISVDVVCHVFVRVCSTNGSSSAQECVRKAAELLLSLASTFMQVPLTDQAGLHCLSADLGECGDLTVSFSFRT